MTDTLIREIWASDLGAPALEEENAGERGFWIQAATFPPHGPNPGDPGRELTDIQIGSPRNLVADGFTGGPDQRMEHVIDIPTRGYDRLFVEWSGICVASTGFAVGTAPGTPNSRTYYHDVLFVSAHGVGYTDAALRYTRFAASLLRSDAEHGQNLGGWGSAAAAGADDDDHVRHANGKRLFVKGTGINFPGLGSNRHRYISAMNPALALQAASGLYASGLPVMEACRFWGYTEYDGAGVARPSPPVNGVGSRLPMANDMYGFVVEIGWPDQAPADRGTDPSASSFYNIGKLTVEPFERVQAAFCAVAPNAGPIVYPGPVAHIVAGRLYAILTRPGPGEVVFIDRQGKVTVSDATTFQTQGERRK